MPTTYSYVLNQIKERNPKKHVEKINIVQV